jgi:hypothetical protein
LNESGLLWAQVINIICELVEKKHRMGAQIPSLLEPCDFAEAGTDGSVMAL